MPGGTGTRCARAVTTPTNVGPKRQKALTTGRRALRLRFLNQPAPSNPRSDLTEMNRFHGTPDLVVIPQKETTHDHRFIWIRAALAGAKVAGRIVGRIKSGPLTPRSSLRVRPLRSLPARHGLPEDQAQPKHPRRERPTRTGRSESGSAASSTNWFYPYLSVSIRG